MKKTFRYLLIAFFSIGLFASCLEDKGYTDIVNLTGNDPVVSLATDYEGLYPVAIPISASEPIAVPVTAARANSDLTATFKVDAAAVDAYNEEHADDEDFEPFTLLPSTSYSITSLTVSIPKGTLDVDLEIKVNSLTLGLDDKYMLPLTLVSIGGDDKAVLAQNYKQVLLYVQLKNRFDGKYKTTGTMVDALNSGLSGPYPWNTGLVTLGANKAGIYDYDYTEGIYHKILSGTANSYYGNFGVVINFDADNNVTSVQNNYVDPAPRSRTPVLDPSGVNKWDPVTKTLKIKYFMYENGAKRTSFDETFTYVGSR